MKKKKGMTLVEIVVSIGVYGMLALLLTEIMSVTNSMMSATTRLNERLNYESYYADNKIISDSKGTAFATGAVSVNVSVGGSTIPTSFNGTMYTTQFRSDDPDKDDLTTTKAKNVNYRFMRFDTVGSTPGSASSNFSLYLKMAPMVTRTYPINQDNYSVLPVNRAEITKIVVSGGVNAVINAADLNLDRTANFTNGSFPTPNADTLGAMFAIPVTVDPTNYATHLTDGVTITVYAKMYTPNGTAMGEDIYLTQDLTYNLFVEKNNGDVFQFQKAVFLFDGTAIVPSTEINTPIKIQNGP